MKHVIPLLIISFLCLVKILITGDPDGRYLISCITSIGALNIVVAIHKGAK